MTLLELLYFVFVSFAAALVAQWVHRREGWVWAVVFFVSVLGIFIWFFFSGLFYRVLAFIFRLKD